MGLKGKGPVTQLVSEKRKYFVEGFREKYISEAFSNITKISELKKILTKFYRNR